MPNRMIYLDNNSSTPVDPLVFSAMEPFLKDQFGNPSSQGHPWGWAAEKAVSNSRKQIADLFNCDSKEIFFTSGATESNNWAIFGIFHKFLKSNPNEKIHFITAAIEHNSVINSIRYLESLGAEVDIVNVNSKGEVILDDLKSKIKAHTKLISLMWVNNEIGSINPVHEIGEIAKNKQIYFHTDATQAVGKIKIDLQKTHIDLMSFSGHKIYGPKGIGALYKRKKDPHVQIEPLLFGGGQEYGERSGTLNSPGIVGLGQACHLIKNNFDSEVSHYRKLSELFYSKIKNAFPEVILNGPDLANRSPMNLSLTFPERVGSDLSSKLMGIGVSSGSACSTGKIAASHVLKGIGITPESASRTLRISFGRFNTTQDIDIAAEKFISQLAK